MPTYNRQDFLPRSVSSILTQTFSDFEFVIVDDGSTDESWRLLFKYLLSDSRIRVYFNPQNKGRSYSRNRLIDLSKTEYLAVMDSDDISLPHRLMTQYTYMTEHQDVDVTFAFIKTNGEISEKYSLHRPSGEMMLNLINGFLTPHITMMVHKSFLEKHHIYYGPIDEAEDYELYYQMFINRGKFYVIQDFLADARIHHTNPEEYYRKGVINYKQIKKKFQAVFFGDDETLFEADLCKQLQKIQESNRTLQLLDDRFIKRAVDWYCYNKKYGYDEMNL